ncbi:MAG: nicotinate (nicotinamide) nucleotide adenylyltransferase [Oscillibacter sp.]|nr:nicotinate (nicotinamide) nucleotide adenylyltransferase [Oscillibacter sp.]
MKIGIYGGTFNPPHLGHIAAARAVVETLNLQELYLIPAGLPPHKPLPPGTPDPQKRLEMTRIAGEQLCASVPVRTLDIELRRDGKSYTVETLETLNARFPDAELWLLMGTDMFLSLHNWYQAGRILSLAGIAAFGRTGEDMDAQFSAQREALYRKFPQARIFTLAVPDVVDVSSTEVRETLPHGGGARLLPPAVYGYILREGLYGTREDLKHLPLSRLRPVALSCLHHRRIPHVLGAEQEAIRLSIRYGANVEQARRAALLHDCTKRCTPEEHFALCARYGIEPDPVERANPKLLHALTGAAVARETYGMDPDIVRAIRYHTTGRARMSLLEKIMYLADYIEPSRDFPGVEDLRRACYENLDDGLSMGLEMTIREMNARGEPLHRATLEALEDVKGTK